jgi:hypothetical protein
MLGRNEMTIYNIDESQQKAARVAGFTYLLTNVTATTADLFIRSRLIVDGNAAQTAHNILASERLFRISVCCDLLTFMADVALIVALYVILKPVNRSLALLAAFWRLVETSILVVTTLHSMDVLRLLSGAAYLRAFEADRLQAMMMLSIGAHGAGYNAGLIFFGLGSAVFSYLFFKSNYIPRLLAAWGVFSSLLTSACTFAFIIFPNFADRVEPACFMPILSFELAAGLWLLVKGLRHPAS